MPQLSRALLTMAAFAGLSSLVSAQTSPQLTVGPGLIYTVASRATNGLNSAFRSAAVVFQSSGSAGKLYITDNHSETVGNGLINLANVYAIDLGSGQVTRVAGTLPNHTNGNVAGCVTGTPASCPGDGGPATSAPLYAPAGLALDSAGNLYIADSFQQVIRRVDTSGTITTIAGTGQFGVGNESIPATQSQLNLPQGLAFDAANDLLYLVDSGNNRVRTISLTSGTINTVAGNGTAGFSGDAGAATNAQLNNPIAVTVDSAGNFYIADARNNVIRRVAGGTINTVAGNGTAGYTGDGGPAVTAQLNFPNGVAVDPGGSLYITDSQNNRIRKVTGDSSHTISTIAGNGTPAYTGDGGPALSATLNGPGPISIDGQNNLYFVDNSTIIRRILSTPAPLTLPLTAVGNTNPSPFPLTLSNTGTQSLTASYTFPSNFTAGSNGGCPAGGVTLSPGQSCTLPVNFSPTSGGSTSGNLAITNSNNGTTTNVFLSESNGLYFVPVSPCRVVDTRLSDPTFGGGPYSAGQTRTYAIRNSAAVGCPSAPIPSGADVQAYSLNVTVVPKGKLNFITVYPGDPTASNRPNVSTLNSYDGRIKANAVIVPANTGDPNRAVSVYASDPTDVIVDINGYYVPESNPGSLAYYPLPPCRAVDTRSGTGLLGQGSFIQGGNTTPTNYSLTSVCSLPSSAQAYALNYTAIPRNGKLGYLTTWPAGTNQPVVSTLNASTGAVTANSAIVPVGSNGAVSVYSSDDTDLIIDVAGYYAPPAASGLALYNVSPCRAFDYRTNNSGALINGVYSVNVGGNCNVPATAQSYVLNATVLPNGSLSYITTWAQGSAQPVQSVLNAYDAAVTSNLVVVPTVSGYTSTFTAASTGLILDLSAYFAP